MQESGITKMKLLNHPFVITNGTKKGLFVVYDEDIMVDFYVNALKANSTLGIFFRNMEFGDGVFLLETAQDVLEGFWIDKIFDPIRTRVATTSTTIYGYLQAPVGRKFGYPEKWIIESRHEGNLVPLSRMNPSFSSQGEFFKFITNWSQDEKIHREKMRELRENLETDLHDLRETAKFFPINGEYLPERASQRIQMLDLSEWVAFAARKNDLGFLAKKLSELRKLLEEYLCKYEPDKHSEFALGRFNLISSILNDSPEYFVQLRQYDLAR